jgi:hypothetical protein
VDQGQDLVQGIARARPEGKRDNQIQAEKLQKCQSITSIEQVSSAAITYHCTFEIVRLSILYRVGNNQNCENKGDSLD